jgi:hypothetical protein
MFSIINAALWAMTYINLGPKLRNKELDLCREEHTKDESSYHAQTSQIFFFKYHTVETED